MSTAPALERVPGHAWHRAPQVAAKASACNLSNAVHIWVFPEAPLVNTQESLSALRSTLSPDELTRAGRFHYEEHRNAFVTNRGRLRFLLARYLDCAPRAVQFVYGDQGKPALAATKPDGLTFNLSHTDGLTIVAISKGRCIGVDVERIKLANDLLEIARQHFCPAEFTQLQQLHGTGQLLAFYQCWTRKEAFLKGLGEGLARSLNTFEVSLFPGQPAALLSVPGEEKLCQSWDIHHLELGRGFTGALAYERMQPKRRPEILTITWSDEDTPA